MTELLVYTEVHPETASFDGQMRAGTATPTAFATLRAQSSADFVDDSGAGWSEGYTGFICSSTSGLYSALYRNIITFKMPAMPVGFTITEAWLEVYGAVKVDDTNLGNLAVNIYNVTPTTYTGITAADFSKIGTTAYSTPIVYDDWGAPGWNGFLLNSTAIALLTSGASIGFGLREVTYDVGGVEPTWGRRDDNWMSYYVSEYDPPDYVPYLFITYTIPGKSQIVNIF